MKALLFGLAATIVSMPAAAATYLPTGVQTNVALSTVTNGGWTLCYSGNYSDNGASVSSIAAGCGGGTNLMLAARATGSSTLLLLAQAPRADVLFDTGTGNVTHNANGVEWYYNASYSWGFAPGGATVSRNSCDINGTSGATAKERLCWHTGNGAMNGGWRAGDATGLNDSRAYEKLIFVGTPSLAAAVPEPATWGMMILGFGVAGAALRRARKPAVRFAV